MFVNYYTPTRVNTAIRVTDADIFSLLNNPDLNIAKHSKNFREIQTLITDNPNAILHRRMARLLRTLDEVVDKQYHTFRIPKSSGGYRTIEAPVPEFNSFLKRINMAINHDLRVLPHNAAYAYTGGRSAYDALVTHQRSNARWFLKIDLKNFFPSITSDLLLAKLPQVYPMCEIPQAYLEVLVHYAVNDKGVLPQGSAISPTLSNIVMQEFDLRLTNELRYFHGQTYCYTRYADDLLISCPYTFKFADVLDLIKTLMKDIGLPFKVNKDKIRYASMSGSNWNLGLMYNNQQRITIGSKRKENLRAQLHHFINERNWTTLQVQQLIGNLAYLKNVEPEYYNNLITKYERKNNVSLAALFKAAL